MLRHGTGLEKMRWTVLHTHHAFYNEPDNDKEFMCYIKELIFYLTPFDWLMIIISLFSE